MNCRSARANFSGYVEQELSELERRALMEHIQGCPRCGSDLGAMQKAISLLRWVPRPECSPDFTERLMARIRAGESQVLAPPSWVDRALDDLRQRVHEISAVLATPAPAGALVAALLVGGGGGALVAGMMGASGPTGGPSTMAVAPIIGAASPVLTVSTPAGAQTSAPGTEARGATANTQMVGQDGARTADHARGVAPGIRLAAGPPSPAGASGLNAAVTPGPGAAGSRRQVAPSGAESRGIEVAEWASEGGKRLEGLPEGPPPISRVEYVLDQVDFNRKPVAVTTGVRAQEGSITF